MLQSIKEEVIPAVEKVAEQSIERHVNGGIRSLTKKVDDHIAKMEPIYEAYDTASNVGNFTVWISKVFLAIGAIIASIAGVAKLLK